MSYKLFGISIIYLLLFFVSNEQVTLMLSILFIYTLFRVKYIFAITLLIFIWIIDKGNASVVALICLYALGSIFIYRKAGFKVFFLLNFIALLLAYILSTEVVYLLRDSGILKNSNIFLVRLIS